MNGQSPGTPAAIPPDRIMLIQEEPRGPSMVIEVQIPTNGQGNITLPVVQQLQTSPTQRVVINGIRLVTIGELAVLPTNGFANAPLTELQKLSLNLYSEGWQKGFLIPLLALNNTFIEGSGIPWRDRSSKFNKWEAVDWNKSSLVYSNGQVSAGAPYGVLLEVEYIRYDTLGNIIKGPAS